MPRFSSQFIRTYYMQSERQGTGGQSTGRHIHLHCRLALLCHTRECDRRKHREHGKLPTHTPAASLVFLSLARQASAVCVALSAVVRPTDMAADHPQPVRSLRRLRPRRHPYLPYRISKTPRHTRLFPHSARHRAAHKAWFSRKIQRPIPKIQKTKIRHPSTTTTYRHTPQISPLLRPGRIYREETVALSFV